MSEGAPSERVMLELEEPIKLENGISLPPGVYARAKENLGLVLNTAWS